jgi:hypothetical protein
MGENKVARVIKRLDHQGKVLRVMPLADVRKRKKKNMEVKIVPGARQMPDVETRKILKRASDNIMQKCYNPNNPRYHQFAERGIGIADCWKGNLDRFVRDVWHALGPRPTPEHSLDRIDNERGYEPGNLRWATKAEQATNRRSTAKVTVGGVELERPAVARAIGEKPGTVGVRMRREAARAHPYIAEFEANWNKIVQEKYGRPPVLFSNSQKDEVIKASARIGGDIDLIKIAKAALMYWPEFSEEVEYSDGLANSPARPRVEFFTKYLETAVIFWRTKRAHLNSEIRKRRRAEQDLRDRDEMERQGYGPQDDPLF